MVFIYYEEEDYIGTPTKKEMVLRSILVVVYWLVSPILISKYLMGLDTNTSLMIGLCIIGLAIVTSVILPLLVGSIIVVIDNLKKRGK